MYLRNKNSLIAILFGLVALTGCTPYMKGTMDIERQNYAAAIENFEQVLSDNPNNWQARRQLGLAYMKTGQNEKAISEFQGVLGQEPGASTAFGWAPGDFYRAPGQKPGDPFSTYNLGLAYLYHGQRSEALETFKSYRNEKEPLVEDRIREQLIPIEIFDSIQLAKHALEIEKSVPSQKSEPEPGTVAVFYFKDLSPDNRFRYLQKAMAEMIITDLAKVKSLQVLERTRVQFLLTEMKLGQTGIVEEKTAPRAGRLLRAENLIVGSLEPGSLEAKASVASTTTEDVIGTFSVTAKEHEFFDIEKEIVYNILELLPVTYTAQEEALLKKLHTKNLQAVIYFGQGLDALDAGHWKDAKVFFRKAYDEDREFGLAEYYLSHCPGATVASINSFSAMTVGQLAGTVESAVDEASADQQAQDTDQSIGVGEPTEAPPTEGNISISW